MANTFVISDTHFGHANICKFLREDGSKVRPWNNVEEMDEVLVENWNNIVKQEDKVYHLGDVVMNRKHLNTMRRLNGKKVLIKGNHDIFDLSDYTEHFYDVRAYHKLDKFILSHIPIHPQELGRFKGNVHGHLHANIVLDKWGKRDERYLSVCVEHTEYSPIELSVIQKLFDY